MGLPTPLRAATLELSQARLDVLDVTEAVDLLADSGINTLVVFALGYGRGEAYYPSEHAACHELLGGRDLFGDILAVARSRGLAVCGYVNSLFGGPEFHQTHPDWTQRWPDGQETVQGEAKGLCPNSPYRRHILDVAAEVTGRYAIDGFYLDEPSLQSWCSCRFCRDRFREDTGHELPLVLDDAAAAELFLEWRSDVVAEFIAEVGQAVRAVRPGVTYFAQHAFPLASTAPEVRRHLFWGAPSGRMPPQWEGWYRPGFYGQDIVKASRPLDIVGLEPWRRFVGQPPWWEGVCVSYARSASGGKPVVPLMEYPHFPWGLARLPDDELAVSCADVVANGGDLWFPMYAPDAADREGWRTLGRIFTELDGVRPRDAADIAEVGVLVSRRTAERFGRRAADDRYLDDLLGTVQLLRELHLPHRMLSAEALSASDLEGLSAVVAPSAACLDEREAELLAAFVHKGGGLLATGWTGTHGGDGEPRSEPLLADVLGVRLAVEPFHAGLGYLVPHGGDPNAGRVPVRDEQPTVRLAGAEQHFDVMASWDLFSPPANEPVEPSVTMHGWGEGRVVYCGIRLGRLRRRYELFESRALLGELLGAVGADPRIHGGRMGTDVALHAWKGPGSISLMLVNFTGLDTTGTVAELGPQTMYVRSDLVDERKPVVTARGAAVTVEDEGTRLAITLNGLAEWECISLHATEPHAIT